MLPGPSETPESTFTRKIVKYYQYMEHVGYLGHKKKRIIIIITLGLFLNHV